MLYTPESILLGKSHKQPSRQNHLADWYLPASATGHPIAGMEGSWEKWLRWQTWRLHIGGPPCITSSQGWSSCYHCQMSNLPEIDCPQRPTWQRSCGDQLTIDDKLTTTELFILERLVICSHRNRHTFRCGFIFPAPLTKDLECLIHQHEIPHCIGPENPLYKKAGMKVDSWPWDSLITLHITPPRSCQHFRGLEWFAQNTARTPA